MKRSKGLPPGNTQGRVPAASRRALKRYRATLLTLVLLFVVGILLGRTGETIAQSSVLFKDTPYAVAPQISDPIIQRVRYVAPDFDLLAGVKPGVGALPLNLFEDVNYRGVVDQIVLNSSGSTTWAGYLEDVDLGSFILVARNGVMVGTIKTPGAFYRIGYVGEGIHAIYELSEAAFPAELRPRTALSEGEPASSLPMADDGSVIDVLVTYTDDARLLEGGTTAIENLIDLAIAETNLSYANSGISQRLNLVHTAEVAYDESGFSWSGTLNHLTYVDGVIDEVHTLRDANCADEVVLLVADTSSCGIGWIGPSASYAFSVVSSYCATGYYSFAHELGHNMGALHDWYVDKSNTYAHGYVNPTDSWRTIMAYNSECGTGYCTRLQYWSNPAETYGGDPMGVPDGTSRSCSTGISYPPSSDCDADNHKKLNSTAITVANFRDSSSCPSPLTYAISGYVRDANGDGVGNVAVDFEGYKPVVTTDSSGYFVQSGFINAPYDVSFSLGDYRFVPPEKRVFINGGNATMDAAAYAPASVPYSEGFESGSFGSEWLVETDNDGRVVIGTSYAHDGVKSLLLDDAVNDGTSSRAGAILSLDLRGISQLELVFWWQDLGDELQVGEDGVFISDDRGATWHQIYEFNAPVENTYSRVAIDLDEAVAAKGLSFTDDFWIKFQFYDNEAIPQDGFAIDDVVVGQPAYDIRGTVRDPSGSGIAGVTVEFDGARPAVTTNATGVYSQTNFTNTLSYQVSFSKAGTFFSPLRDSVTISNTNVIHDATGYPINPVTLPFTDTFETGSLSSAWAVETDYEGRVQVSSSTPHQGVYSLLMDDYAGGDGSFTSHAAAILPLDLSAFPQVVLSFWWREFNDENHPDDGVFISADDGASWHQVYSFNDGPSVYTQTVIDLDSAASAAGVAFNDRFLVKFQFYDNYPSPTDGYAIDDVEVYPDVGPLVYNSHTADDNDLGDSQGDNDGVAECGEAIELFVELLNQGSATATAITATISTSDPYVTFLYNVDSAYPDIVGGGTGTNLNDFDFLIDPSTPDGHLIPFVLDIQALYRGPWRETFNLYVGCYRVYLPLVLR